MTLRPGSSGRPSDEESLKSEVGKSEVGKSEVGSLKWKHEAEVRKPPLPASHFPTSDFALHTSQLQTSHVRLQTFRDTAAMVANAVTASASATRSGCHEASLSAAAIEEAPAPEQQNDQNDDDERVCVHRRHVLSRLGAADLFTCEQGRLSPEGPGPARPTAVLRPRGMDNRPQAGGQAVNREFRGRTLSLIHDSRPDPLPAPPNSRFTA